MIPPNPQMSALLLLFATIISVAADSYDFGVDLYGSVSRRNFDCLKKNGYKLAFLRVYQPDNGGKTDAYAVTNIKNAWDANVGIEIYVQPDPLSSKSAATQFREAYQNLNNNNIPVDAIWLLVTYPISWPLNPQSNVKFIQSFLQEARSKNIYVGIYTNWYDWYLITGNYQNIQADGAVMLWYWNTLGVGTSAESVADYSEFRTFGGWKAPTAKQFAIEEQICGVTLGRNVFKAQSSKRKVNLMANIAARGLGALVARDSNATVPALASGDAGKQRVGDNFLQ